MQVETLVKVATKLFKDYMIEKTIQSISFNDSFNPDNDDKGSIKLIERLTKEQKSIVF